MTEYSFPLKPRGSKPSNDTAPATADSHLQEGNDAQTTESESSYEYPHNRFKRPVYSATSSEEFVYSRRPENPTDEVYSSQQPQSNTTPQRLEQQVATDDPNLPLPDEKAPSSADNSSIASISTTNADSGEDGPTVEEENQRENDAMSSGPSMSIGAEYGDEKEDDADSSPEHFKYRTSTAAEAMESHIESTRRKKEKDESADENSSTVDTVGKASKEDNSNNTSSDTALPKFPAFALKEAKDGFYIQVGDNQFHTCEDEPIATPGAIQSFGCLLVVELHDDEVRVMQASENVNVHLGGLSVRDLFKLNCFTDVLNAEGASKLHDVLFELTELDGEQQDQDPDSIHTFPLSGYGVEDTEGSSQWWCWCAAQRAADTAAVNDMHDELGQDAPPHAGQGSSRIILEFEPIYDPGAKAKMSDTVIPRIYDKDIHPLYPMNLIKQDSNSADDTIMNNGSAGKTTQTHTNSTNETVKPANMQQVTDVKTNNKDEQNAEFDDEPYWSLGQDSFATLHEIRRSTLSKSKPLRILQRSQRTNKVFEQRLEKERKQLEKMEASKRAIKEEEMDREHLSAKIRRHMNHPDGISSLDVLSLCQEIDGQLAEAADKSIEDLYDVIVGLAKDITNFDRVLLYKFDSEANGVVVSELMNWQRCNEIFHGLHFPASDIPAQARELYKHSKVRQLYDRDAKTSQVVVRNKNDLKYPLDMSGCALRAMSPIHIRYLKNMNVRSSLSISIVTQRPESNSLFGLVSCHSFEKEMRVSFPQMQMLKMFSDMISRNMDNAIYKKRLQGRGLLMNPSENSGSIASRTDVDLLRLFDSDNLIICYNGKMKIIGNDQHYDAIKQIGKYLKSKKWKDIRYTTKLKRDYPDLDLDQHQSLSGLLFVPLSEKSKDGAGEHFVAFIRSGQLEKISWAGNPSEKTQGSAPLQPRASFKKWTESVTSTAKEWQPEELESASVLSAVYSKVLGRNHQSTKSKVSDLLMSNVDKDFEHELRTPLHHFCSYLDMALEKKEGIFDKETRKNLKKSKSSAQSMLYAVNDLIALTTQSEENAPVKSPMNIVSHILGCIEMFKQEMISRNISIEVDTAQVENPFIVSDSRKIRVIFKNLLENAIKYNHERGKVLVSLSSLSEYDTDTDNVSALLLIVQDSGTGISQRRLQEMFSSFEKLENTSGTGSEQTASVSTHESSEGGAFGKGLVQVAKAVSQLQAKMTCSSRRGEYTKWQITIPLSLASRSDIEDLTNSNTHSMSDESSANPTAHKRKAKASASPPMGHVKETQDSQSAVSDAKAEGAKVQDYAPETSESVSEANEPADLAQDIKDNLTIKEGDEESKIRLLTCDDDPINNNIIKRRLRDMDVVLLSNGQKAIDQLCEEKIGFDVMLLDLMMPVCDGRECVQRIRKLEKEGKSFRCRGRRESLPIFAFSASITPNDLPGLKKLGFDGFFLKPLHFVTLIDIVSAYSREEDVSRFTYKIGKRFERGGLIE
ncbi:hypothetical protein E3P99_03261 [Wallemia hederae]|uniref:Phytochrome n=1 Tax=Wallemia hederae TaxID=1540922 RepID=A0A4T0FGW1_9BASI|nr:hypothetical protein E3P99_03261 [Wallemia hederae]